MLRKLFLALPFALLPQVAIAQTSSGSISGLVTDPSGAVLADVSITATEVNRNTHFRATTNATGFYMISLLPPGTYQVTAEKAGFRRAVVDSLPLSTQEKASVDIVLQLGVVSEQVQVTSQAQLIEATNATLSAVMENKRIVDLPLNGRNIYDLAALVPGVFNIRQTGGNNETFSPNRFTVNGGQDSRTLIAVDGVSAMVQHEIPGLPAVSAIPSVEGIQEFRIQTNSYSAEYGRTLAGVVTMASKSGTNEFRGTVYEFLRNSVFDANNFFANRAGIGLASFKQNQFGANLGGPVRIPKVYNGKDRTFFFFNYEGKRTRSAGLTQQTLPTELEKNGDFTQTFNSAGQMKAVYNPFTSRPNPAQPGRYMRDPFAGNVIPRNMMDPVSLEAQKFYPSPNGPGLPYTRQNNFILQGSFPQPTDRYEFKVDHNLSDRRRFFVRYSLMDSRYGNPNWWGNPGNPFCCPPMNQRLQNGAVDYTETISPSTVLSIRYGIGRAAGNRPPWYPNYKVADIGLPSAIDAIADYATFPNIGIQDYTQLGPNTGDIYLLASTSHTLYAGLMRVSGRHSMKFGGEFRSNLVNNIQFALPDPAIATPTGAYRFYRAMTQGPDPLTPTGTGGAGYASFLLGTGGGAGADAGAISHQARPAWANHYAGWYVQDDFKVNSKLTLNLGFRWDFENGARERYDRLGAIDLYVRNPLSDQIGREVRGGWLFADGSLGRRAIREVDLGQLNPRIGLAYQLNEKTVLRSGYGVFFGAPSYGASRAFISGGSQTNTPWLATLDSVTPNQLFRNPFPAGFNRPQGSAGGLLTGVGSDLIGGWPEALRPEYGQNWNFTIQRSLGAGMAWEIAYAGNKGTRLSVMDTNLNQLQPGLLALGDALLQLVPNPFYGLISVGALSQPTVQMGQLLRPHPQFDVVRSFRSDYGNSNYHALQTRFEKRFSAGLSLMSSYTWSKVITDGVDGRSGAGITNWYCRTCSRGVSTYDQPHRWVTNFNYELPIGRGKTLGSGWNRGLDLAFGQWQVNGIVTISQGLPLTFGVSQNTSRSLGGGQRPDASGVSANLGDGRSINRWFDTTQFLPPKPYTFGTLGRTVGNLRGDDARHLDLSVFKNFQLHERVRAQLRAEAFNLANHPLFARPNTTQGSPTFGVVSSQENTPRQVQLGLKIIF